LHDELPYEIHTPPNRNSLAALLNPLLPITIVSILSPSAIRNISLAAFPSRLIVFTSFIPESLASDSYVLSTPIPTAMPPCFSICLAIPLSSLLICDTLSNVSNMFTTSRVASLHLLAENEAYL
jgi:hypothetical protein